MPTKNRVLVADDDFLAVVMLRDMLESQGYEVLEALNGQEAINQAMTKSPDLMLLDIMMPIVDGKEVCRRLKREAATHDLPIIMLTALSSSQDIKECFDAGAADYLIKPVEKARLLKKIETAIRKEAFRANLEKRGPGRPIEAPEARSDRDERFDTRVRFRNRAGQLVTEIELAAANLQQYLERAEAEGGSEANLKELGDRLKDVVAICSALHQSLARQPR